MEPDQSQSATALICVSDDITRSAVSDQLTLLGYELHSGLFREDVALRLQTHAYNLLVLEEGFENLEGERNPVIMDCRGLSPEQRRSVFIVLIGPDFKSEDGMQAFQYSVDLVFATEDLSSLAGVLGRSVEEHQFRYQPFLECIDRALVM